ncbi:MAG: hypothetical protein LUG95_06015 [Clostridiales bacterium]|nr:hypothetical protein [Clostridiales bacterium]
MSSKIFNSRLTSAIFTAKDGVEQFAEYVTEKSEPKKKSIKEAFTDLINRIVETIKKALSRASLTSYRKEYLEMEQKQAEEIRTLFLSSLDKAAENYKNEVQEQADTSEQKK